MANYPSFPILESSQRSRVDGIIPLRASNGTLTVRKTMAGEKFDYVVDHFLNKTDKDTLEQFYQDNKLLNVTFRWPGDASTTTVRFTNAPLFQQLPAYWFRVQVRLSQT